MDRLVLIDGHAILHRAYHAYPPLTTSKGELVNAVYGFANILLTVLRQLKPKYVAVAFDKKGPTFRHKEYKDYKAHRPKMDKELENQMERVHEVVKALNIPIFEVQGYEADDVIGTLAKQAGLKEVIIVTGDQDALQLVNNEIKVFMPGRGKRPAKMFDRKTVLEKYGFEPRYLIDFKALAGDPSDEIPGVKGIGPKTAKELISALGSVEEIFKSIDKITHMRNFVNKKGLLGKLKKGKKVAFLSKKLATIVTDVPIKLNLRKCLLLDYDKGKVIKLFEELEFRSLIKKLPSEDWKSLVKEENKVKEEKKQMELF